MKQIHEFGDGSNPKGFTQVNEKQFVFQARSIESETYVVPGTTANANQYWLWVSDGTEAGTKLIAECATLWPGQDNGTYFYHWMRVGRKVFFKADTKERTIGGELWITDGTAEGTHLVKDINYEPQNGATPEDGKTRDSAIDQMVNFNNKKLFFKAWTPATGNEPWASDGTPEGTYIIKDTNPTVGGNGIGNGGNMTEVGQFPYKGKVYGRGYVATSDTKSVQGTTQLGCTNLEPGDFKILEVNVSPASSGTGDRINSWPDPGVEFNGFYLFCAQSGMNPALDYNKGGELHYTDGETVWLQSDMAPGVLCNWVKELTVSGGSVYWWCDAGELERRQKLFRLDDVKSFPVRVTNFDPNGDQVYSLRNLGGNLLFTRGDDTKGLYCYSYRKPGFDPAAGIDMGIMDIDFGSPTGIEKAPATSSNLVIYPNPTTDKLYFATGEEVLNVKIYDLSGRLAKAVVKPAGNSVSVSSLSKGIYSVVITSAKNSYNSKLIVK